MKFATLQQALDWVAGPAGLDPGDPCAIEAVNDIRGMFYYLLDEAQIGADISECFRVQVFTSPCNPFQRAYCGISLPFGCQSVIGYLFRPQVPADRWRWYTAPFHTASTYDAWGQGYCRDTHGWHSLGANYPSECDLLVPQRVKLLARDIADEGCKVRVNYQDTNGNRCSDLLTLTPEWTLTEREVSHLERPGGIVFESPRKGRVVLASECGDTLSVYEAAEQVPAYKRLSPSNGSWRHGEILELRIRRELVPLSDPLAVVETGNWGAWKEMAAHWKLQRKSERNSNDRANANESFARAREYLLDERRREVEEQLLDFQFRPERLAPMGSRLGARSRFRPRQDALPTTPTACAADCDSPLSFATGAAQTDTSRVIAELKEQLAALSLNQVALKADITSPLRS